MGPRLKNYDFFYFGFVLTHPHTHAHTRHGQCSLAKTDAAATPTNGRHRRLGGLVALAHEPRVLRAQREPRTRFLLLGVLGLPKHVVHKDLAIDHIEWPLGNAVRAVAVGPHQQ